jgi:NAD(P)-dependent dehydrogenase (short-subunit alcohol dehydrogenase family)
MSLVCLVTGCSEPQGFGWLIADELRRRGHVAIATMRDVADRNRDAAAELGRTVEVAELDVTDETSIGRLVADILSTHGRIDAIVNNAATVRMGALEDTPAESLRAALDVNVVGPHRLIRAVLPHMRERGEGVIVQMSSISGFSVAPLFGSYSTSKHALEAYSETLAYEVGHFGIRVAIMEPGAFLTGLHDRNVWEPGSDDGSYAELKQRSWDAGFDDWVGSMEDPMIVARAVADAIQDPATPLHVPVGGYAATRRGRFRTASDEELRSQALGSIDW